MRKSRLLPAAFLLTGLGAAALAVGVLTLGNEPNYFSSVARLALPASHEQGTGEFIGALLNAPGVPVIDGIATEDVRRVYAQRQNRPLWTGSGQAAALAEDVLAILRAAPEHGLDPRQYHLPELTSRDPKSLREAAEYDLLLTDGVLRYAREMRDGRKAARVDRDILVPLDETDLSVSLAEAAARGAVPQMLAALEPQHPQYARLRSAFTRYRAAAAAGNWPQFQTGAALSDATIARLRQRLAIDDPQLAAAGGTTAEVAAALRRYQARNGLPQDGRLNAATVRMLNVAPNQRAAQLAANMERWRWLPDLAADRIEVDVTAFELTAYRDNRAGLNSRVVVGEPGMRTPILATSTRTMTLNPPWNIPTSIIRNEILPRVRRNPNFLASQRVRIVKGSLDNPNTLQLQQSPGPMAALGKIKLEMPNPFDVYLHDTPTKAPFARPYRAVSHGCVRVQEIFALGSFLLRGDTRSGLERINSVVATGSTRSLALPKPFAVYMVYWTVVPDANGALAFRQDLYGRDTRMIAAMGDMAVSAIPPDAAGNPT